MLLIQKEILTITSGVPITLLSLNHDEDFVVIEAGANKLGEIDILAKLIQPDVAAVTNIGLCSH
jgi:UDP-N-acetylmuramoyl-tripeptide--D-alanyl-D-alanine ligase